MTPVFLRSVIRRAANVSFNSWPTRRTYQSPSSRLPCLGWSLEKWIPGMRESVLPQKCNVIYEIPCKSCNKTYIGETGRSFITRRKEHQKECEKETAGRFTQTQKQTAEQENLKSAITDHCRRNNHIMDWDMGKIITSETNKLKRWIKEAIEIRRRVSGTINQDEGAYTLSHTLMGSDRSVESASC